MIIFRSTTEPLLDLYAAVVLPYSAVAGILCSRLSGKVTKDVVIRLGFLVCMRDLETTIAPVPLDATAIVCTKRLLKVDPPV